MTTQESFRQYVEAVFEEVLLPTMQRKGDEYVGTEKDTHWNFASRADMLDMHVPHVIVTDATKQLVAIAKWSGSNMMQKHVDDQLRERIDDVIIYMLLLRFWLSKEDWE